MQNSNKETSTDKSSFGYPIDSRKIQAEIIKKQGGDSAEASLLRGCRGLGGAGKASLPACQGLRGAPGRCGGRLANSAGASLPVCQVCFKAAEGCGRGWQTLPEPVCQFTRARLAKFAKFGGRLRGTAGRRRGELRGNTWIGKFFTVRGGSGALEAGDWQTLPGPVCQLGGCVDSAGRDWQILVGPVCQFARKRLANVAGASLGSNNSASNKSCSNLGSRTQVLEFRFN